MTDRTFAASDVFDLTQYVPEIIKLTALNNPGIFGSAMAQDISAQVNMTNGGKSVSFPTINFLANGGTAASFQEFTGTALATNGGTLAAVEVPLTEYGLPLQIIGTTLDQAFKTGNGDTIINMFVENCGEKMAEAIDKHLVAAIVANGQTYHRLGTDTKLANALLGARALFGDKQNMARNLVMNGLGGSALIAEHLDASATGANTLVNGQLTNYLGCNVVLSDNVADDFAILGLNNAIKYVVKNVKMHTVVKEGQTFVYEFYFSIAAYIPSPNGMKGVVYADLSMPPAALKVTLSPAGAVSAGAKWSIDGGTTWKDSAATVNVTGNSATIKFKETTGYDTPADKVVTDLPNGVTTEETQAYTLTT